MALVLFVPDVKFMNESKILPNVSVANQIAADRNVSEPRYYSNTFFEEFNQKLRLILKGQENKGSRKIIHP